ncbi:MAG: alpha/beta fold hydrolase [Candidatus Promineofilum sp.]|nr:alpha/beta fold hydrolase [Promineifilum sp.]
MPTRHTNGINLHYETVGQGAPLLFLHGLGSRGEDWTAQIPFFARNYRVITADMRGHGQSDKPPGPYSVSMMAHDVLDLLDGLQIDAAHIVGLSMGGMIAFQLAVDRPERVRSLVIVNSGPALVARTAGEWLRIQQRLWLAQLFGPARTGRFLSRRLFPKPDQSLLRAQFIERWAQNDRDAYLAALRALVGWTVLERIGEIQCPVLVIAGDRDYTPLELKREYTARIRGAHLVVIEDSGHATPIDQTDKFDESVLEFLERISIADSREAL